MFSFGFDTLIINNLHCSDDELTEIFNFFTALDITKFVFIHDFDFRLDNLTLTLEKFKSYSKRLAKLSLHRSRVKVCANLLLVDDAVQYSDIRRLRISNKNNSVFVSIPVFQNVSDNRFSTDLNKLLYRLNLFPIFTSFDYLIKSVPDEFSYKLLSVKKCGFVFDLNFLLDARNSDLHTSISSQNIHILPSISHGLGNYVGAFKSAEHLLSVIGKSEYYKMCSMINHTSSHLGF
ncbi:MAG: hypothetical protein E7642_04190 [Ruminococcaceae bacterium]|nr:hypothetical protein [Oscillospiraceae bacterium]